MGRPFEDGGGYVKLWRSIRQHPNWFERSGRPASRFEAFLYLLIIANWKRSQTRDGDWIERGQVLTSLHALQDKYRWGSLGSVRRFLEKCSKRDEICFKTGTAFTVITISNYDKWQSDGLETEHERNTNGTRTELSEEIKKGRIQEHTDIHALEEVRPLANGKPIRTPESLLSEARLMIGKCRAIGDKYLGHAMTEPPNTEGLMRDLLRSRPNTGDTEGTILEVFEFYCRTTLKRASISFRWFFEHYETLEWKLRQERQRVKKA